MFRTGFHQYQKLNSPTVTMFGASLVTAIFIALAPAIAWAVDFSRWKSFGATDMVRSAIEVDGELWALTSGGVVRINTTDLSNVTLTNVDGLRTGDIETGMIDANNTLWLGGFGWLVKREFDNSFSADPLLDENNGFIRIYKIVDDDPLIWAASDRGLELYSKTNEGGQFQDSYQRFGAFPARTAVIDALLTTDTIWAVTASGLAVADRRDPALLKSFANWTTFSSTSFPELGGSGPRVIRVFAGGMCVGTSSGLYSLTYDATDTTFSQIAGIPAVAINDLNVINNELWVSTMTGLFSYDGATVVTIPLNGTPQSAVTTSASVNGRVFVGIAGSGVYAGTGAGFTPVVTGAIPDEQVEDISANAGGQVVGAFSFGGFAMLKNGMWESIERPSNRAISVAGDSTGAMWLGTFGNGAYRIQNGVTTLYDTTNSSLKGNNDGGANNFVVVPEIVSGTRFTYLASFRASDGAPVAVVDQLDPGRWTSIGIPEGVTDTFVISLDEHNGRLALGSEQAGIFIVDPGPDPFNKADYVTTHYHESSSDPRMRLPSDEVRVVRFDRFGDLWAGSSSGLARFDAGIERFVEVVLPLELGPEVTDIAFDPLDNVWISAPNGLGKFDRAQGLFETLTALNSGLVSENIRALDFAPATNALWIATDKGISVFTPNLGQPNFDIKEVTAYPNPFVVTQGTERLHFNFSGVAIARIYTEAGELVWSGMSNEGWTGKNQSGRVVASGVYFFTLSADTSDVGVGKFLLIRNR